MKKIPKTVLLLTVIAGLTLTGCGEQKLDYTGVTPEIANEQVKISSVDEFKELGLNIAPLSISGDGAKTYKVDSKEIETLYASSLTTKEANYTKFIDSATGNGWVVTDDNADKDNRAITLEKDDKVVYVTTQESQIPNEEGDKLMQHTVSLGIKGGETGE